MVKKIFMVMSVLTLGAILGFEANATKKTELENLKEWETKSPQTPDPKHDRQFVITGGVKKTTKSHKRTSKVKARLEDRF